MKIPDELLEKMGLPKGGQGTLIEINPNDPKSVIENLVSFVAMVSRTPDESLQYLTLVSSVLAPLTTYMEGEGPMQLAKDVSALAAKVGRRVIEDAKSGDPLSKSIVNNVDRNNKGPLSIEEKDMLRAAMRNVGKVSSC